jgi:hypothetical protein
MKRSKRADGKKPGKTGGSNQSHDLRGIFRSCDADQPDRFYTNFTGKEEVILAYANLLKQQTLQPSDTITRRVHSPAFMPVSLVGNSTTQTFGCRSRRRAVVGDIANTAARLAE